MGRGTKTSAAALFAALFFATTTQAQPPKDPVERYRLSTQFHLPGCSATQFIALMDPTGDNQAKTVECVKRAEKEIGPELQAALRAQKSERARDALRDFAGAWLAALRQHGSVSSGPSAMQSRATEQRLEELWARFEVSR